MLSKFFTGEISIIRDDKCEELWDNGGVMYVVPSLGSKPLSEINDQIRHIEWGERATNVLKC